MPDGLEVGGPSGQRASFPLHGEGKERQRVVVAAVFTRTNTLDQYGGVFNETINLLNADRRVLCTLPGRGWDQDELTAFLRAAGLTYSTETLANYRVKDKTYPRLPATIDITESSRGSRRLATLLGLGVPLVLAVLLVAYFVSR